MDTRLKNNKKARGTAVFILAVAAVCFAFLARGFKDKVDYHFAERGSDFESEEFINVLLQCNYVLYPEVLEKSGRSVRVEELYLSFEQEEVHEEAAEQYYGSKMEYWGSIEELRAEQVSMVQNSLLRINSLYMTEIGTKIDYCVIDGDTQNILKNTTKEIELLKEGNTSGYRYYFITCYDQNGVLSDIRVSESSAERFLKNAQMTANSSDSLLLDDRQRTTSYVLVNGEDADASDDPDAESVSEKTVDADQAVCRVTVTQTNPKNVTFIYAMTEEQMKNFSWLPLYRYDGTRTWVTDYIGIQGQWTMYEMLGLGRYYQLFLAGLAGIVFVLVRRMPQRTADTAGTRHCAELIWAIQWIVAVGLYNRVISFVCDVNETNMSSQFLLLSGVMFVLFGVWYWCLLSIRNLFINPRAFLEERSVFYRNWALIKGFFIKIRDEWRADMAGIDLGKDVTKTLRRLVVVQVVVLSVFCSFWFFGIFGVVLYSLLLYWRLRRYIAKIQRQYQNLMQAANAIAQGKFDNTFEGKFGVFESYKQELYQIQGGFRTAVEEEVKSQRMKTELITNVSHDLKTPLTAIITYIDLLKEENITEEQKRSYLQTLERKSLRLKVLIEDLFEISKASSGNVRLELVAVDICNLIRQVYLEHEDKMKESALTVRFDMPEEKVVLQLDSQKTYRIFENLYVNIIKYAMQNTRVYINADIISAVDQGGAFGEQETGRKIRIVLKNISAQELTVQPRDLTERFVRGDVSRNTEGSGLGLAIAKSFTELQGGSFHVEIDGDLFKAVLEWELPC